MTRKYFINEHIFADLSALYIYIFLVCIYISMYLLNTLLTDLLWTWAN